jgi:hypothetical protein
LTLSNDEIVEFLESFDKESRAIKKNLLECCWHMRGGLTYDDAMMLGTEEIDIIRKIIEEHLDITKKSGIAYF